MRIAITGVPGSGSTEIGLRISDRLGLAFISAEQVTGYLGIPNERLADQDAIVSVNKELLSRMRKNGDFVCDAIISSTCFEDTIDIFLYSSIFLEEMAPRTIADKRVVKRSIAEQILSRDYTNPDYYHIWIDRTGIDDDYLVDFIISKLQDYAIFSYIPARMCLPAPDITEIDSKYNVYYSYPVTRHLASYLVHENLSTLDECIRFNKLIPVTFIEDGSVLQEPDKYVDWFNMYSFNNYVQLTTYLSWYCIQIESEDLDDTYCTLERSGRVLERLEQWYDRIRL